MMAIAERPSVIHVFEDCEKLYKTDVACSLLRAACGAPRQRERWVTYETAHETLRVNFTGGIVIVSNENLAKAKGPLAAVASRFRPIKWDLSMEERIVRILKIAESGWQRGDFELKPNQCKIVAKFLVEQMTSGDCDFPVDLRTYVEHALPAYAQSQYGDISADWREVLKAKLAGQVQNQEKRGERNDRLEQIALQVSLLKDVTTKERGEQWRKLTGLGLAIYYRHLKSAKAKSTK
jgi:hypothetical protein